MALSMRLLKGFAAMSIVLSTAATWPGSGWAGAVDELRPVIDKVLRLLADPELHGEARARERRAALRSVMENAIDFPEAARRALAVHWRARADAERDEFVTLFRDLVTYSYIRVIEPHAGETILIAGESQADGVTTVLTRVHRPQGEPVAVDYRMHLRGTRWLIYDVVVDRVSLLGNYRVQFNAIIQTSSYEELVRRIRVRVLELNQMPAAAQVPLPRG